MISGFGIVEFSVMNESGSLFALRYQSCYVTVLTKYLPIIYPQAICISVQYKGTFIAHCIGPAPIKCGNLYVLLLDRVTVDTDPQCGNRIIAWGVGGGKSGTERIVTSTEFVLFRTTAVFSLAQGRRSNRGHRRVRRGQRGRPQ